MPLATAFLKDLRRIAEAVDHLRDRTVHDVYIRSDCRQLRMNLDDGRILLVSIFVDEQGVSRLDADVIRPEPEPPRKQLEVRFEDRG